MSRRSPPRLTVTLSVVATSLAVVLSAVALMAGGVPAPFAQAAPSLPINGYTVVRAYPHDARAFTQGLEVADGYFYEGTGLNGSSTIRKVRLETGEIVQMHAVAKEHFGEGISIVGRTLYQLTWQSGLAFLYDRDTFRLLRTASYRGEGWGLTHDQAHLIMSDGTEELRFIDPAAFREIRRVKVTGVGQPVKNLNELEYVKGEVFANIWQTDYIARIDPASGRVKGYIHLRGLMPRNAVSPDAVLNGIAYDARADRLFVTGKLWPRVFEIRVTPPK